MKRLLAGLCTATIIGLMMWIGLGRSPSSTERASDSETGSPYQNPRIHDARLQDQVRLQGATDQIERLLASAREGDASSYLNAFGGALRARLEREADENGRDAFAVGLRKAGLARKSHAIFTPEREGDRDDAARITVESTFADRLERQTFHLARADRGWLVIEVETAREQVPPHAPGSPATFAEPEGIPVATDASDFASEAKKN
jgi:hypothetical protein